MCPSSLCLETYEYQGGIQILVMPLDEFLVIFFGLLVIFFVEFSPRILLDQLRVLPWAAEGTSV